MIFFINNKKGKYKKLKKIFFIIIKFFKWLIFNNILNVKVKVIYYKLDIYKVLWGLLVYSRIKMINLLVFFVIMSLIFIY